MLLNALGMRVILWMIKHTSNIFQRVLATFRRNLELILEIASSNHKKTRAPARLLMPVFVSGGNVMPSRM